MHVNGFWTFMGAILMIALVATVLTKANTGPIVTAAGTAFDGVLGAATAG